MVTSLPPSIVTCAFWTNRKVWIEVPFIGSNSRGLSINKKLQEHEAILLPKWTFFKGRLFIYFVVDTRNVLPVMSKKDKSAGLWKVKVCSQTIDAGHNINILIWSGNVKMQEIPVIGSFLFTGDVTVVIVANSWWNPTWISLLILADMYMYTEEPR